MDFRKITPSAEARSDVDKEIKAGRYVTGPYVNMVEKMMQVITGKRYVVATDSGTSALKIALAVNGMSRDDQIAVPDLTFIGCVTAVMEIGSRPVPVEVDERGVIDWGKIPEDVDGIMAVLLGGQNVKVPEDETRPVVLDCAHYIGRVSKRFDACFSFHPSKIISSLGGGCFVTDDEEKAKLARRLRMFGFEIGTRVTDRVVGFKGYMSNVSAVLAFHELINWPEKLEVRTIIKNRLNEALGRKYSGLGMYLVEVPWPDELTGQGFIRHWPKTISEMVFGREGYPVAERLARHLVSTPFHEYMANDEVDFVIKLLQSKLK